MPRMFHAELSKPSQNSQRCLHKVRTDQPGKVFVEVRPLSFHKSDAVVLRRCERPDGLRGAVRRVFARLTHSTPT